MNAKRQSIWAALVGTGLLLGACASDEDGGLGAGAMAGGSSGATAEAGAAGVGGLAAAGSSANAGAQGGGAAGSGGASAAGTGGTGIAGAAGAVTSDRLAQLRSALDGDGFDVQDGSFSFLDLGNCCDSSCLGNNPSSPYAAFYVPPAKAQTAANPGPTLGGTSAVFRLAPDEAIVYVGKTPPKARYFGWTPYLAHRTEKGKTIQAFASLSETANQLSLGVEGGPDPFGKPLVLIVAHDQAIDARARAALVSAGYPAASLNTLVLDPTKVRAGLQADDDTFAVLFRMALFDDGAAGEAYRAAPPGNVLRLTPRTMSAAMPFPSPLARAKNTTNSEALLTPAVDALADAIAAKYPTHNGKTMVTTAGQPDPDACIAGKDACAYDNRDTIYPATVPQKLLDDPDDFVVVFGVNHETTGKASYAGASVYSIEHLYGAAAVSSKDYAGSAADYLPSHPDVAKLYAWKIARDCQGDPHCLTVPVGTCPNGIPSEAAISLAFRVYLEPATATGPDPSTLVIDRAMRFTKKKL